MPLSGSARARFLFACLWRLPEEVDDRLMRLLRAIHLRHVAAVDLHVAGERHGLHHVALEADWHELVARAPDEQRAWLERLDASPEAVRPGSLLEVDVACRCIEGDAAARRQIGAQELVDAGSGPVL